MEDAKKRYTSKKGLYKWLCYGGLGFVLYIFQSVGLMPEIAGVRPAFLLVFPICAGISEGPMAGAATGGVCGIFMDAIVTGPDGFFSAALIICCAVSGALVMSVMRNTIVTAMALSGIAVLIIKLAEWFFFVYFARVDTTAFRLVYYTLPSAAYTILTAAPVYFLVLWIKSKFDAIGD